MDEIKIIPMKPDEADEAAQIMAMAFINTPFSGMIMGGNSQKHLKQLKMGMKSMLVKKPGDKVVAKEGNKIVGAMRMVKWPDCQNSTPKGAALIPIYLIAYGTAKRLKESRKVWGLHDPKKPHWHIDPICVHPDYQGKGVGSRLMEYYCRRVDSEKLPAYHETDQTQNVRFYEKFGYKTVLKEPNLGLPNWYLWREGVSKQKYDKP
jgi:ribosomal protein S18 acetylase RimI-like enzyme